MRYRLVCLDAGFTLLAPRSTLGEALRGVLGDHGHDITDEQVHRAWEVADRWFWDNYQRPENDTWGDDAKIDAAWREYHSLMLRELGVDDSGHQLIDTMLAAQYAPESWELYPDVLPAVRKLRELGLRLGVVSDWGSNLLPIVDGLGLGADLDFVIASGAVGLSKPDPALFRLAATRAGVPPAEALMVGDSYRADIEGAESAGMDGILIRRPEWQERREAVPPRATVIASLAELPEIVSAS
ncbi:MAG: HAD-IA family hydrolase [Chloroflexi bacterium]|nr:HAD-IA family hydrolase [Chloroflexota bacterium]